MATIAYDSEAPGKGATRPTFAQTSRSIKFVTGQFSFDSSYPTGGEDISDIAAQFKGSTWLGIVFGSPNVATKRLAVDNTGKKIKVFIEDGTSGIEAEAANASDQSGIAAVRFLAWGYV